MLSHSAQKKYDYKMPIKESADKARPKLNIEVHSSPVNPKQPEAAHLSTDKATFTEKLKKEKEEEAKNKAEFKSQKDIKKHQEELKKKKQEEIIEKKKEQEKKKSEAKENAKEVEKKKKENAIKKNSEEYEKKRQEFKIKQAQDAEKKRKELEEKYKQIEEKKKKKEDEKKKLEEEKKEPKTKEVEKIKKKSSSTQKKEERETSSAQKKEVAKIAEEEKKQDPAPEVISDEPSYSTFTEIQEALNKWIRNNPEILEPSQFALSSNSKKALNVFNAMEEERIYLTELAPAGTILLFRLFFQLSGQSLPDNNKEAWGQCQAYLADMKNKAISGGKALSEQLEEMVNNFDFSFENIEKCEQLAKGHHAKLSSAYHKDTCPLAESMALIVREGLIYAGIAEGEGPSKLYSYLLYKQAKFLE